MSQQTVLIADSSRDFLLSLAFVLQGKYRVLICHSGIQATELLRNHTVDLMVLDLSLPHLDQLRCSGSHPIVLATSFLQGPGRIPVPCHLDLRFLIQKPVSPETIAAKAALLLTQSKAQAAQRKRLEEALSSLGVHQNHDGWDHLLVILPSFAADPHQSFTKILYPQAGKVTGHSAAAVDRAIRYALQCAWAQGDPAVWQHYFPGSRSCPSNSVFIRRLAEELYRNGE